MRIPTGYPQCYVDGTCWIFQLLMVSFIVGVTVTFGIIVWWYSNRKK